MIIERQSIVSGNINTMDINVTDEQISRWEAGELIQNAMPDLTPDEREFIMTGVTSEEWRDIFGDDDGDHTH